MQVWKTTVPHSKGQEILISMLNCTVVPVPLSLIGYADTLHKESVSANSHRIRKKIQS